ncbi:hypothetical protein [Mesorhizobium sp. 2RAF21]|uniref:hypothetical protein n=1 Tax=Mesorhizobium sp. 2RAF21 TaxID=3232995 RepID=UPI003F99577C
MDFAPIEKGLSTDGVMSGANPREAHVPPFENTAPGNFQEDAAKSQVSPPRQMVFQLKARCDLSDSLAALEVVVLMHVVVPKRVPTFGRHALAHKENSRQKAAQNDFNAVSGAGWITCLMSFLKGSAPRDSPTRLHSAHFLRSLYGFS